MIFGKSNESDSQQVKQIFEQYYLPKGKSNQIRQNFLSLSFEDFYEWVDIEKRQDCKQLENYLRFLCFTDRRKVIKKMKK
jgi:hypothetical protein